MQFVDRVTISVESGAGGDGLVSWRREKFVPNGGPAGGDGGDGGSVYLEATNNLQTLLDFNYQSKFKAQNGEKGGTKNCHGKSAEDLIILVPCGTVVFDADDQLPVGDLTEPGQRLLVAMGGRGGRGNARFASSRRQAPQYAEPGEPGVDRGLTLELKLIADVGLVGMPNAGKSTLISVVSAAKPKIANYPFTTLTPNLGVVRLDGGEDFVMADIPGLIEGASEGVGLGHDFLRHVERNRLLLHLVDIASPTEAEPTPQANWETINQELKRFSETLAQKPQILVLTKADALTPEAAQAHLDAFRTLAPKTPIFLISAVARQNIDPLLQTIAEQLRQIPKPKALVDLQPDYKATRNDDSQFEVAQEGPCLIVRGGKIDRLMRVTDLRNPSATRRMMNIFKAMGVQKALEKAGATEGQTVIIGSIEFEYAPEFD